MACNLLQQRPPEPIGHGLDRCGIGGGTGLGDTPAGEREHHPRTVQTDFTVEAHGRRRAFRKDRQPGQVTPDRGGMCSQSPDPTSDPARDRIEGHNAAPSLVVSGDRVSQPRWRFTGQRGPHRRHRRGGERKEDRQWCGHEAVRRVRSNVWNASMSRGGQTGRNGRVLWPCGLNRAARARRGRCCRPAGSSRTNRRG